MKNHTTHNAFLAMTVLVLLHCNTAANGQRPPVTQSQDTAQMSPPPVPGQAMQKMTEYLDDHVQQVYRNFDPNFAQFTDQRKVPKGEMAGGNITDIRLSLIQKNSKTTPLAVFGISTNTVGGLLELPLYPNWHITISGSTTPKSKTDNPESNFTSVFSNALAGTTTNVIETNALLSQLEAESVLSFGKNVLNFKIHSSGDVYNSSLKLTDLIASPDNQEFVVNDLPAFEKTSSQISWIRQWSDSFHSLARLSYDKSVFERDQVSSFFEKGEYTSRGTFDENNMEKLNFEWLNEYRLNAYNLLSMNASVSKSISSYDNIKDNSTTIAHSKNEGMLYSMGLKQVYSRNQRMELSPTFKISYFAPAERFFADPAINIRYRISDKLTLQGQAGMNHQFISRIINDDVESGRWDIWLLANDKEIPLTTEINFMTGLAYAHSGLMMSADLFHRSISDIAELSLQGVDDIANTTFSSLINTGDGTDTGMELFIGSQHGKFNWSAHYSLNNINYDFQLQDNSQTTLPDMFLQSVRTSVGYSLKNWHFMANWNYSTGRPNTEPTGVWQMDMPDGTATSFFVINPDKTNKLPDYHRLDLTAAYNYKLGKENHGKLMLTLNNVYNRKNTWYRKYAYYDNQLIKSDVAFNGFTPSVSFMIYF